MDGCNLGRYGYFEGRLGETLQQMSWTMYICKNFEELCLNEVDWCRVRS